MDTLTSDAPKDLSICRVRDCTAGRYVGQLFCSAHCCKAPTYIVYLTKLYNEARMEVWQYPASDERRAVLERARNALIVGMNRLVGRLPPLAIVKGDNEPWYDRGYVPEQ
jgi:hypothetical protein